MVTTSLWAVAKATTFTDVVLLLSIVTVFWYVLTTIIQYRRLRHIPGPPLAGFTWLWWLRAATSQRTHLILSDVSKRYGSFARIAPNTVLTDDLEYLRKINGFKNPTFIRSKWYEGMKFNVDRDNVLTMRDEEQHTKMRQKLAPGYAGKDNPALESWVDEVVLDVVQLINQKYNSYQSNLKPLDFAVLAKYFTLDVTTYLALGEVFGYVRDFEDKHGYCQALETNMPITLMITSVPLLSSMMSMPMIQKVALPKETDEKGFGKVLAASRAIIKRHFEDEKSGDGSKHDMVYSWINHGLSEDEIADGTLLLLLAGSDTTATVLRTGFLSIISNPRIHQRVREEIVSFCQATPLSSSEVISHVSAQKLPYLQACVKEAIRFCPPAAGILPRQVGPAGDYHKGIYLPPGTEIASCIWNVAHDNPGLYGADANFFRPERWLEASPDQVAKMEEGVSFVFGHGRFKCMGENIARMELNKLWFELLRRFEWATINPQKPIASDLNYGVFIQHGMWLRAEERTD